MAEALDRLPRSQEETANLYSLRRFHEVRIFMLSEGWITELHVGLSSTMNAVFLRQLAEKARRGLASRVESGRSAGGLSYGDRVPLRPNGLPQTGHLEIVPEQAAVIRRIFTDYGRGLSPRAIAAALNAEGVRPTTRCIMDAASGTVCATSIHQANANASPVPIPKPSGKLKMSPLYAS